MNDQPEQFGNAGAAGRLDLTLPDGYKTYCVFIDAAEGIQRQTPVLYMHGIQSHPGWFAGSAGALAAAGFPVYKIVRRGSGENKLERGHASSARQLLDDVDSAVDFILSQEVASKLNEVKKQEQDSANKINLLGVSWGGKLLTCYCLDSARAAKVENLVLVAPGIVPQVDVPVKLKMAIAANLIFGGRKLFPIPLNDVELFTENPVWRQFLTDDPLRLHDATAKFLFVSRMLDLMLKRSSAGALKVPTTLLLASRDRIINNDATSELLSKLAGENLRVNNLDAAHTMEFEQTPQPFYDLLIASLKK